METAASTEVNIDHLLNDNNQNEEEGEELKIVLIGKTGSGKSSTGNTLLGEEKFREDLSSQSITKRCASYKTSRFGRHIRIVDTPGLFDTRRSLTEEEIADEIKRCVTMLAPGPHAFLFVMGLTRYTDEEDKTVEGLLDIFGKEALNYMLVVFTHKDQLVMRKKSIEEFLKGDERIKKLTNRCPIFTIDNVSRSEDQVKDLLEKIEANVERNGGEHFTHELLQKAYEDFQRKKKQLEEEEQRKFEEKVKPIREKFENEQKAMNEELSQLQNERDELDDKVKKGQTEFRNLLKQKEKETKEFQEKIEAVNEEHNNKLKKIESERNNAIKEIQSKLDYEKNVIANLEKSIDTLKAEMAQERRELEEKSNAKIEKIMSDMKEETERERKTRDTEIRLMSQMHKEELERVHKESETRFTELNENLKRMRSDNEDLRRKVKKSKRGIHINW